MHSPDLPKNLLVATKWSKNWVFVGEVGRGLKNGPQFLQSRNHLSPIEPGYEPGQENLQRFPKEPKMRYRTKTGSKNVIKYRTIICLVLKNFLVLQFLEFFHLRGSK